MLGMVIQAPLCWRFEKLISGMSPKLVREPVTYGVAGRRVRDSDSATVNRQYCSFSFNSIHSGIESMIYNTPTCSIHVFMIQSASTREPASSTREEYRKPAVVSSANSGARNIRTNTSTSRYVLDAPQSL